MPDLDELIADLDPRERVALLKHWGFHGDIHWYAAMPAEAARSLVGRQLIDWHDRCRDSDRYVLTTLGLEVVRALREMWRAHEAHARSAFVRPPTAQELNDMFRLSQDGKLSNEALCELYGLPSYDDLR